MDIAFRVRLTNDDWDQELGGWRCPALRIPGSAIGDVFSGGKEINKDWYAARSEVLRWTYGKAPEEVAVSIVLTKSLSTDELTMRWRKAAVILPVIAAIVVALIGTMLPKAPSSPKPDGLDEQASVIHRFYEDLNGQRYDEAWALIHRARKAEISLIVKDANDFKKRYVSTTAHTNIKIAMETDDATEPIYVVAFDVQDDALRSTLYQLKEQRVDESVQKGIVNKKRMVDLVFANLNDYFIVPDQDKLRIEELIGKRRLSSLFSPVFIQEFAEELGLDQRLGHSVPLKDSIWRHFIYRLAIRKEENDWKIRRGLDKPVIAEYGPGAPILSK